MTVSDILAALAATGLAFVSFQLGGIFWGIVIVRRLGRPEAIRRSGGRDASARPAPAVGETTALGAGEPHAGPARRQLAGEPAGESATSRGYQLFRCVACRWHTAIPEGATRVRRTTDVGSQPPTAEVAP